MTTQQAAETLGISVRRVQALIKAGRLNAAKRGRDWWIEEADLNAVFERPTGYPKGKLRR